MTEEGGEVAREKTDNGLHRSLGESKIVNLNAI